MTVNAKGGEGGRSISSNRALEVRQWNVHIEVDKVHSVLNDRMISRFRPQRLYAVTPE